MVKETIAKSECSPPAAGSTVTKNGVPVETNSCIGMLNMRFKSHCLKHWSILLKATPPISELMRSGLSLIMILSLRCLSASCCVAAYSYAPHIHNHNFLSKNEPAILESGVAYACTRVFFLHQCTADKPMISGWT